MGQSATLYRIPGDTFRQLESAGGKQSFDYSSAKSYVMFQGSFMGLEYVLSKQQNMPATGLISEIFNPAQSLGGEVAEGLSPEEQFEFYENGHWVPYIDPITIGKLDALLKDITIEEVNARFNAEELNDNGIYPEIWHNDNSDDLAFNKRHIAEDFLQLKEFVMRANEDNDYVLVFIG